MIREATFCSDSINDLPLLSAVANPVAVDPDLKLVREVAAREWSTIQFREILEILALGRFFSYLIAERQAERGVCYFVLFPE